MNIEKKEEILKELLYKLQAVSIQEDLIAQNKEDRNYYPKNVITDDPITRTNSSMVERYAIYSTNLEYQLLEARYERIQYCKWINDKIESMDIEKEKNFLKMKYMLGWSYEKIGNKMNYSYESLKLLRRKALEHFPLKEDERYV